MSFLAYLRKGLASLALTSMVASFVAVPLAQAARSVEDFTDYNEIPSWAVESIEGLMGIGVLSGNGDGSFAPNRQLNRAEVSKIIVLATGVDIDTAGGPHFPDVGSGDWYYDFVETMYNYGWINGYPDGLFRPGVGINRAEIAKMVVNAFGIDQDLSGAPHFDDVGESDWFYGYVETVFNNNLMRGFGDGTFGPAFPVTRAETARIVFDALLAASEPTGPADGTVEVTLSSDTPRGTNIPFNATSVPFTTVEFSASDDSDVEVSSLTFTRLGLGDNDDFDNVWLEVDGFKVGNDKSVNNDDVAELRFNPPLIVPAGQTIVADIVASLEVDTSTGGRNNTGHHNRFALITADDVVSTAENVVGDFPIEGEEMEIADYEVSQLRFSSLGSDSTIDVGDNFIEIGKFRLLNDSNTNKDIELRAITFKNDGTAELEDDLENVSLYVSGEQVSAETIIDGDYVTLRLDNGVTGGYIVEDGDSRIFSLRADIVSAEKDDVINFKIDNFEDVVGVEVGTSFGVKAVAGDSGFQLSGSGENASTTSASCTTGESAAEDDCGRLKAYVIDAGDLNVSRDPSSIGNQEYAPGSNDVVFLTARVVVDQPMIVDGTTVVVEGGSLVQDKSDTNTTADDLDDFNVAFDNFRLYLNDKLVDSENDFTLRAGGSDGTTTDYQLVFNTTFEIAGTSILKLVGNIEDDADTGDKLKVSLAATSFEAPEYISTGDQVQSDQLLGSATGSFVEVEESTLLITRTDGLSDNDSIVAGVDDVTFLKFVLDNNDSGNVNVTSITIDAIATGAALGTNGSGFSNFTTALFVDGKQQGSGHNLEQNGQATFNDISVVTPSAGQKEFVVVVDTIEESANTDLASTTASACNVTSSSLGTPIALDAPGADTISTTVNVTAHGIAAGSTVAFGPDTDGNEALAPTVLSLTNNDTETATVASVTTNTLTLDSTLARGHSNPDGVTTLVAGDHYVALVTTNCTATATQFTVADASDIEVGDSITVGGAGPLTVSAVSGNVVTTGALGGVVALPAAVAEQPGADSIRLFVREVEADNLENGQDVKIEVTKNGSRVTLGENVQTTAGAEDNAAPGIDGDCDTTTVTSDDAYLCGALFALIESGSLSVSEESTVFSDIITANSSKVEVLRIQFNASDDEIHVKDIYLENDGLTDSTATALTAADVNAAGDRLKFFLYDAAGQLIDETQMVGNDLHFELANQRRIRVPKDDSTYVVVKVDAHNITEANQTGNLFRIRLRNADGDATTGDDPEETGLEAVTAATGSDLEIGRITHGAVTATNNPVDGEQFIIYRTEMTVRHSSTQPSFSDPTTAFQQVYRFTVTADQAREIELGKLTFDIALSGMNFDSTAIGADTTTTNDLVVKVDQVKSDGTIDDTADIADTVLSADIQAADTASVTAIVTFDNQQIGEGQSRTYSLSIAATENGTGTDADDDSVNVTIKRDDNPAAPVCRARALAGTEAATDCNADADTTDTGEGATDINLDGDTADTISYNMVWSDESDANHDDATIDWLNGYLVEIDTTALVNND